MQVTEFSTNVDREKLLALSLSYELASARQVISTSNGHITLSTRNIFNHF